MEALVLVLVLAVLGLVAAALGGIFALYTRQD